MPTQESANGVTESKIGQKSLLRSEGGGGEGGGGMVINKVD